MLSPAIMTGYCLITLVIGACLYVHHQSGVTKKRRDGIAILQALRYLTKHFQVHRGYSAAYLTSLPNSSKQLDEHKTEISKILANISDIAPNLEENENWRGITRHWAKLSVQQLTLQDSYTQHCKIISSTIELMRSLSYHYKLTPRHGHTKHLLWYRLLQLSEVLGKIRANGIRYLSHDSANYDTYLYRLKKGLIELSENITSDAFRPIFKDQDYEQFVDFEAFVNLHLIGKRGLITPELYFDESTKVIDIVFEHLDKALQNLEKNKK